ncbi:MAG: zinc ribbon domain-containing protein [Xanthomonadales bacterium]|nr:zinc ribbon domain-containing protein [Xanthomonadales bacterium]
MPIYFYQPTTNDHCDDCKAGFEVLQKVAAPKLTQCPECGAPTARAVTAPNIARSGPSLDEKNIEKHGFTQYRKVETGVYEKTAGKGPKVISDKR